MSRFFLAACCVIAMLTMTQSSFSEPARSALPSLPLEPPLDEDVGRVHNLEIHADTNCIYLTRQGKTLDRAVRQKLKANQTYKVTASGKAFLSSHTGRDADPIPGVVLFYGTNEEDGHATKTRVVKPGEVFTFTTPKKHPQHIFLLAFFIDYWPESKNRGHYDLKIEEINHQATTDEIATMIGPFDLNINFAYQPKESDVVAIDQGKKSHWNFVDYGQTSLRRVRLADGSKSNVKIHVSENDGEWGISEHTGYYHGYIYHNCKCVDLSCTVKNLRSGIYEVYVFAHGDAPNQNAAIEIQSNGVTVSGKSTLNDGTWRFQSSELVDGNQYVKYLVNITEGEPVIITSKRDGSDYSMLNAIQFKRLH